MKQLFINGKASDLFFSKQASFESIFEWVKLEVILNTTNPFNLNEQHSCSTSIHSNTICISGDEDSKEITIEQIEAII
tara:strand:+ start:1479 stop:1712 length:234 start_codon:yes stop_codon:yes gene_type:complete